MEGRTAEWGGDGGRRVLWLEHVCDNAGSKQAGAVPWALAQP